MKPQAKLLVWALILLVGLAGGLFFFRGNRVTTEFWGKVFPESPLKGIVEAGVRERTGYYGVVVESLHDSEGFSLNQKETFEAASLYKLVLMAATLKDVEEGRIKLESTVSADTGYLSRRLGSVDFGYEEVSGSISYSVEQALRRVATISDNYAAIMLTDQLERTTKGEVKANQRLEAMARELGMSATLFDPDIVTTPEDVAAYFRRLYSAQVVSKTASEMIIDLLAQSKLNNRIPALLPKEIKVSHKTGELAKIRHDAGIVYLEGRPYLIVMMSKELKGEDEVILTMAELSKAVFDYFNSKPLAEPKKE